MKVFIFKSKNGQAFKASGFRAHHSPKSRKSLHPGTGPVALLKSPISEVPIDLDSGATVITLHTFSRIASFVLSLKYDEQTFGTQYHRRD